MKIQAFKLQSAGKKLAVLRLLFRLISGIFLRPFVLISPVDGTSSQVLREEVTMENGRSPALSTIPSEPEAPELMEGATAAVGRKQNLTHSYQLVHVQHSAL